MVSGRGDRDARHLRQRPAEDGIQRIQRDIFGPRFGHAGLQDAEGFLLFPGIGRLVIDVAGFGDVLVMGAVPLGEMAAILRERRELVAGDFVEAGGDLVDFIGVGVAEPGLGHLILPVEQILLQFFGFPAAEIILPGSGGGGRDQYAQDRHQGGQQEDRPPPRRRRFRSVREQWWNREFGHRG